MKKKQAARQRFPAAFALIALALTVTIINPSKARADVGDPDFLVLNPERE
jgi:hypothetical protein